MSRKLLIVRALLASALYFGWAVAMAGPQRLDDFAVSTAAEGRVSQAVISDMEITGVAFRTESSGCKMVGVWYDAWPKAIRNYRVCGPRATVEGFVPQLPRGAATETLVTTAIKGAVMRGESSGKFEEFAINANRLAAADGGVSCSTELIITVQGLLSFYGVQDFCN